jgi:hypothetical protein
VKAILSDIHGNLEALEAVLADIDALGVRDIYCLGDIVCFGPNPRECIELVRQRCSVCLLGNRDQDLCIDDYSRIPDLRHIFWMREQMDQGPNSAENWEFLASLERSRQEGDFLFVHGSPRNPINEYIFPEDVYNDLKLDRIFSLTPRYCLHGHSHIPGVITEDREFLAPEEAEGVIRLDERKALCDVGSVGQPRDGDLRACYVLLDDQTLYYRRIPYDIAVTRQKTDVLEGLEGVVWLQEGRGKISESVWLTTTDPNLLLLHLGGQASGRKLRLFICAFCRRHWPGLLDERSRRAVEAAESWADSPPGVAERRLLLEVACAALRELQSTSNEFLARAAARAVASSSILRVETRDLVASQALFIQSASDDSDAFQHDKQLQCDLIREIFGNPFRPVQIATELLRWNDATVPRLARHIYDERRFEEIPILADALEDAGCTNRDILDHCRSPGPHVCGCWALDILLGRR